MRSSASPSGDANVPGQEPIWDVADDPETQTEPDAHQAGDARSDTGAIPGRVLPTGRALTGSITSTARVRGPAGLFLADVPNRIIAMVVDIIVLSICGIVLALLFGGLVTESGALDRPGGELELVPFVIVLALGLAISFVYFGYGWVALRGTPGMKLLGLRIGGEADGAAIAWRPAAVRWLILGVPSLLASLAAYVPSPVGVVLSAIGFTWLAVLLSTMAGSPTNQGLHDRAAHTIVVRAPRRAG